MITLENNVLVFRFPEIHPDAVLELTFQRTLRVPDDGATYPLPAGLDRFPLRHIEDHKERVPSSWLERGGVLLPMYQSEALWIDFDSSYPMAVKIAAGKINAVTGKTWKNSLKRKPQDYVVVPTQPWLDGFKTEDDSVNQFVAARLGEGVTVEEQLTGGGEFGGLQIIAYPLKREIYEIEQASIREEIAMRFDDMPMFCLSQSTSPAMGMGLGGKIKQKIYKDSRPLSDWDQDASRCFIHLVNSQQWTSVTHEALPHKPISKSDYLDQGVPWFEIYDDGAPKVKASKVLTALKTISQFQTGKTLDNTSIDVSTPIKLSANKVVTDGNF